MADDGNTDEKDRLSNGEFEELIPHLPINDLLLIEYRITNWSTMIQVKDSAKKFYACNVCSVNQNGIKNLYAHVDGKKHKLKMKEVKQLFHPDYTHPKTGVNVASAKTSAQAKPNAKNAATVPAKAPVTTPVKPLLNQPKKPVPPTKPPANANTSAAAAGNNATPAKSATTGNPTGGAKPVVATSKESVVASSKPSAQSATPVKPGAAAATSNVKAAMPTKQSGPAKPTAGAATAKPAGATTAKATATTSVTPAKPSAPVKPVVPTASNKPGAATKLATPVVGANTVNSVKAGVSAKPPASGTVAKPAASTAASNKSTPIPSKAGTLPPKSTAPALASKANTATSPKVVSPVKPLATAKPTKEAAPTAGTTTKPSTSVQPAASAKGAKSTATVTAVAAKPSVSAKTATAAVKSNTPAKPATPKAVANVAVKPAVKPVAVVKTAVAAKPGTPAKVAATTLKTPLPAACAKSNNATPVKAGKPTTLAKTAAAQGNATNQATNAEKLAESKPKATTGVKTPSIAAKINNAPSTKVNIAATSTPTKLATVVAKSNTIAKPAAAQKVLQSKTNPASNRDTETKKSTTTTKVQPADPAGEVVSVEIFSEDEGVEESTEVSDSGKDAEMEEEEVEEQQYVEEDEEEYVEEYVEEEEEEYVEEEEEEKETDEAETEVVNTKEADVSVNDEAQWNELNDDITECEPPIQIVKNPFALKMDQKKKEMEKGTVETQIDADETEIDADETEIDADATEIVADETEIDADETEIVADETEIDADETEIGTDEAEIIVIDDGTDNEQNENENEPTTLKRPRTDESLPNKRQKIVPNPAAVITEKSPTKNKDDSQDGPRYQSNRVIIPTVHKNVTGAANKTISQQPKNTPKFSSKTFSTNPGDDSVIGLVGVEYVIKIMKGHADISPRYECGLCEIVLDGFAMQSHLIGYNHRLKFCEKHFPTAIRQYRQYMGKIPEHEVFKVMIPILIKLTKAIEKHHGRDLPFECLERDYNISRHEILSKVFSFRHASEQLGPTFTHVVDAKEVDELIANRQNYKAEISGQEKVFDIRHKPSVYRRPQPQQYSGISQPYPVMPTFNRSFQPHPMYVPQAAPAVPFYGQPSESFVPVDNETHKLMVENFLKGTNVKDNFRRQRSPADRFEGDRRFRRTMAANERSRKRSRSRSPIHFRHEQNKRKSLSPLRDNDIWQAYRHLVDQKMNELDELFATYRKDPETHPQYNDEWQKFWKRRKEELIAAGLDHRTHNYQPEWVRFFNIRIEELYAQAVANVKIQSRERLCLPMSNRELTDPKYHVHVPERAPVPPILKPAVNVVNKPSIVNVPPVSQSSEVVSVLRLMTALEEYLGSLGPRIITLLSKALQVEKAQPQKIKNIILTSENCTLLETAMEKFKGLVMAGLLDGSRERALKRAISGIEHLLQQAPKQQEVFPIPVKVIENRARPSATTVTPVIKKPIEQPVQKLDAPAPANKYISNLLGQFDKKEMAAKLAAVLTAQGKTDFDPEQLQNIVTVFSMLEKKKREAANTSEFSQTSANAMRAQSNIRAICNSLPGLLNPLNPSSSGTNASSSKNNSANVNDLWQNLRNIQQSMNSGTLVSSRGNANTNSTFGQVPGNSSSTNAFSSGMYQQKPGGNSYQQKPDGSSYQTGYSGYNSNLNRNFNSGSINPNLNNSNFNPNSGANLNAGPNFSGYNNNYGTSAASASNFNANPSLNANFANANKNNNNNSNNRVMSSNNVAIPLWNPQRQNNRNSGVTPQHGNPHQIQQGGGRGGPNQLNNHSNANDNGQGSNMNWHKY